MTRLWEFGPIVWRDEYLEPQWFSITRHGAWIQIGFFRRYGITWAG